MVFFSDPENLLVVHYSQLRNNTEAEVKKVLEFLEISVTNSTMQCVMKHREGRYHRQKKQKQDLEEVFDRYIYFFLTSFKMLLKGQMKAIKHVLFQTSFIKGLDINVMNYVKSRQPAKSKSEPS